MKPLKELPSVKGNEDPNTDKRKQEILDFLASGAEFCELGDELAIETYRRMGESLGIALANYASVLNPEAFIFAGGVAQAAKWFLEYAQNTFEQHVFHNIVGKVKFIPSNLENRTRNMLGASVLAWGVKEYSLFK